MATGLSRARLTCFGGSRGQRQPGSRERASHPQDALQPSLESPATVMSGADRRPVAFYLPNLQGGGAERVVVNLAEGLSDRGVPVDLVVAAATGPLLDQLPKGVRLFDLRAGRVLPSLRPLVRYLRAESPRALVSSMSHANLVALWAAKLEGRRIPVIVTVHNTMSQSTRQQGRLGAHLWPRLLKKFYPWAHSVVAVSEGAAADLAQSA